MSSHDPPTVVTCGIAAIATTLAALFVVAHRVAARRAGWTPRRVRRATVGAAVAVTGWLAAFAIAATTGALARFDVRPPPLLIAMFAVIAGALVFSFSRAGKLLAEALPLGALVGFQSFRFPLELVMHEAARTGVMPPQMTFTGLNYDIFTGFTAALLGALLATRSVPGWVTLAWNTTGLVLLSIVMSIGVLSTPALHVFGEGKALNTWVAEFPFVWLPAVMVAAALAGHVLVFRRCVTLRRKSPA